MLIKILILLVALFTHIWLWGGWSLEKSMGQTIMLGGASLILIFILVFPIHSLTKKKGFLSPFKKLWFKSFIYLYVLLILFLGAVSFTGLIQYLLPIKIILISVYAFLKYKFWNKKKES